MEENRTLLVVDDEKETLKGYQDFLSPQAKGPARQSSRRATPDAASGATQEVSSIEPYKLLLASSGEEAVQIVQNEMKQGRRLAAGFFDVKLGAGMDGLATIQAIKALDPEIHTVVVTAYHDRTVEEINQLFGEKFKDQWDYLNKPFTQGEIVQKARQMVAAWNRKRQLEAMTQQLIRSERMASIGQIARGVGHEFGNILQRIMGKVDLAMMETSLEPVMDHLKVVMKAAERAGVIVRNLQSFSKSEPNFQYEKVNLALDEAISLIGHELVKNSVELEKTFQETPPLQIDVGGLAQVFLNLMINAAHAMPKGGKISVSTQMVNAASGKPGVEVKIADTGTGIPKDVLPRIFDFAFTTKGDQGSGIGLALSKDIVESHEGTISVQTEVNKGTTFTIWLPMAASDGR